MDNFEELYMKREEEREAAKEKKAVESMNDE